MTTHDALLAAILANPADDLPRLVYADYLEENGEPERAEFIRASIADQHGGQYTASQHLVAEFRPHAGDVSQLPADSVVRVRRGFVAEITCTLSQWCGGECPACVGGRMSRGSDYHFNPAGGWDHRSSCQCNGTGRTTGIGPAVVRSHPVEVVRVTDREPLENGIERWLWFGSSLQPRGNQVPNEIRVALITDHTGLAIYKSKDSANAALSAALIAWAKSQPHPARIHTSPVAVDVTG